LKIGVLIILLVLGPPAMSTSLDESEEGWITGTVRTSDGKPIPESYSLLTTTRQEGFTRRERVLRDYGLETDNDQTTFRMSVAPGDVTFILAAEGYAPAKTAEYAVKEGEEVSLGEIVLDDGFEGKVRCLDQAKKPIPNAEVKLVYKVGAGRHDLAVTGTADADGNVVFPGLFEHPAWLLTSAPGYAEHTIEYTFKPGGNMMRVYLVETDGVRVKVVREGTGDPIPGAVFKEIYCSDWEGSSSVWVLGKLEGERQSDANGICVLDYLKGWDEYAFMVEAPDGGRAILKGVRDGGWPRTLEVPHEIFISGKITLQSGHHETATLPEGLSFTSEIVIDKGFFGFLGRNTITQSSPVPVDEENGVGTFRIGRLWRGKHVLELPGITKTLDLSGPVEDVHLVIPAE
jgi:hypothetical protein